MEEICPVCNDNMGGKDARGSSYGGVCCLSCRAFFRRAHQKTKTPMFECYTSTDKCQITPDNRRRCPKCRLRECLKNGMKPELVLTQQEKGKRFRKLIAKKNGTASINNNCSANSTTSDDNDNSAPSASPMQEDSSEASSSYGTPKQVISEDDSSNISMVTEEDVQIIDDHKVEDFKGVLLAVLEDNRQVFKEQCAAVFREKARYLDQDDKVLMATRNEMLFVNFVFSQYLTSTSHIGQVRWLETCSTYYLSDLKMLNFDNVRDFMSDQLQLFNRDPLMQEVYLGFAISLRNMDIPPTAKPFVIDMLSLYRGGLRLTSNHMVVDRVFQENIKHILKTLKLDVSLSLICEACQTLEAMSQMFDYSGLAASEGSTCQLSLGYTSEEDLWLTHMRDDAILATGKVQVDEASTMEMAKFALFGIPLSSNFQLRMKHLFMERMWKVYLVHPEFQSLSDVEQARTVLSARLNMFALICTRLSGVPMDEQMEVLYPGPEVEKPQLTSDMKPIKTRDVFPDLPIGFEEKGIGVQAILREDRDGMIYFCLLAMIMFNALVTNLGESDSRLKTFEQLRSRYELNIARRFGSDHQGKIRQALSSLAVLSEMIPGP